MIAYGPNLNVVYRRAADYVHKLLKGEPAHSLPVEQPVDFDLVINMKTAKALGLKISQSVLVRANEMSLANTPMRRPLQMALMSATMRLWEATYTNATIIEDLIMAQLWIAQKDPTQAFKEATAVKMLSLAASALERLHATKSRALGLDRENVVPDELPVLTFRDLTPAELKAFQERDEADEERELGAPIVPVASAEIDPPSAGMDSESDEIIVEGEEQEEPGKASFPALEPSWWKTSAGANALTLRGDFVSAGTILLSTEVPFIFDRQHSHALCLHELFFKTQLLRHKAAHWAIMWRVRRAYRFRFAASQNRLVW